jgi:hypothetical protein
MKTVKITLMIVLFATLVYACNSKENNTNPTQNKIAYKAVKSKKSAAIDSPCALVSMDDVKSMFSIVEHPIDMKDVVYTFPTCVFKWEDGKVSLTRSIGGQEIKLNKPSEVLIVMVKEANEDMFNRSTKVYKQPQDISNLATMAVWDSRMSQLTFLSNNYMFHVHVKVSNDDSENKEKAIEVSKLIIGKI